MIIQNGYCKQGDCISCLQRVTILVLDVNGASWSFALDMGCQLSSPLLTAHCHNSPTSDFFSPTQHLALLVLFLFGFIGFQSWKYF